MVELLDHGLVTVVDGLELLVKLTESFKLSLSSLLRLLQLFLLFLKLLTSILLLFFSEILLDLLLVLSSHSFQQVLTKSIVLHDSLRQIWHGEELLDFIRFRLQLFLRFFFLDLLLLRSQIFLLKFWNQLVLIELFELLLSSSPIFASRFPSLSLFILSLFFPFLGGLLVIL